MCDNVFGDICVRHFVYDQNIPLTTYARWETVQMRRKTRNSNNFNGSQIGSFNTNDRYDWKDVNSSKYSRVSMEWKMKTADQSRWEWNDWKNAKTKVDIKMQRAMKMDNVWVYTQPLKQRIINIFKVCMEKVMSPHLNRNRSSILISFRLPPHPLSIAYIGRHLLVFPPGLDAISVVRRFCLLSLLLAFIAPLIKMCMQWVWLWNRIKITTCGVREKQAAKQTEKKYRKFQSCLQCLRSYDDYWALISRQYRYVSFGLTVFVFSLHIFIIIELVECAVRRT